MSLPPARPGAPFYLTPKWVLGHLTVLGLLLLFLRLGWWQILSALNGHVISIGYALQWPAFAGFGVFLWIRTVRQYAIDHPSGTETTVRQHVIVPASLSWTFDREKSSLETSHPEPGPADDDLEARHYNEMLDWLRADPRRHPYQFRRRTPAEQKET